MLSKYHFYLLQVIWKKIMNRNDELTAEADLFINNYLRNFYDMDNANARTNNSTSFNSNETLSINDSTGDITTAKSQGKNEHFF